jgi:hypothetical protein
MNANGSGGTITARAQNINVSGTVDASATRAGATGGNVSIVASGDTTVTGTIKAGGKAGGKGGTVETSGHTLTIGGATVDAGEGGQWLLDPYDLTVDSSAASTIDNSLGIGTDVTLQTTASGTSGPGTANATGNGDILIESALSWNSGATLTLDAYRSIAIDADITVAGGGGGVVLKTNDNADGITSGDYGFGNGASQPEYQQHTLHTALQHERCAGHQQRTRGSLCSRKRARWHERKLDAHWQPGQSVHGRL